jgi:hypothetical protein
MLSETNICNQIKGKREYRIKNFTEFDMCIRVEKDGKYTISNRIKISENVITGHVSLNVNCLIINNSHIYPEKFGKQNCHDPALREKYQRYHLTWYNSETGKDTIAKYQEENKERISIQLKKYNSENKERLQINRKKHYEENIESMKLRDKKWYDENKEEISAKRKARYEHDKEYREHRKSQSTAYYEQNKEKLKKRRDLVT